VFRLLLSSEPYNGCHDLPTKVNVAPKESSVETAPSEVPSSDASIDTSDSEASESGVKTVDTGAE
jgi:hypothetical protein